MMEFLFFWIGASIIVGIAANKRGRDGTGWGILALLISPLLAGLLLLALPRIATPHSKSDPRWANLRSTPISKTNSWDSYRMINVWPSNKKASTTDRN